MKGDGRSYTNKNSDGHPHGNIMRISLKLLEAVNKLAVIILPLHLAYFFAHIFLFFQLGIVLEAFGLAMN